MSVYDLWGKQNDTKLKTTISRIWSKSDVGSLKSSPAPSRTGENIYHNYIDLIKSKSDLSIEAKQVDPVDRPFDFFDDEEFAFGINLLNNNVACVGDNVTKLIQMAQEPWPDNVKLFQPYEVEQILLPDNASCLAVQAFLKMCSLPFEVEMRWNAEFMSPSGRVPFIKCGAFVVSELEPIVQFAANKGVSLTSRLSTEEKAEMRAYMSLITNVLVNAELYISWVDNDTYTAVTKVRNASVYPWPLGWVQTRAKRAAVVKRLKALHWNEKTLQNVLSDVEQCCNSLTQRLGDRDYFFGAPTPLDALVYGHLRALLSADGPKAALMIKPITCPLLRLLLRMTHLTEMKLTPQEEYLVSQAFQLTRRRLSPNRAFSDRNTRVRRSKLCVKNTNRDECATVFGFKPFASKNITVMQSHENDPSDRETRYRFHIDSVIDEERYSFILETLDEILLKVGDLTKCNEDFSEHHDFEIIVFPPENIDIASGAGSPGGLPANEEVIDDFDADIIRIIRDDDVNENIDSNMVGEDVEVLTNDTNLSYSLKQVEGSNKESQNSKNMLSIDSSNPRKSKESWSYISSSTEDKTLLNFDASIMDQGSTESITTLVKSSEQDVKVDELMNLIRERNAEYKQNISVPEVD